MVQQCIAYLDYIPNITMKMMQLQMWSSFMQVQMVKSKTSRRETESCLRTREGAKWRPKTKTKTKECKLLDCKKSRVSQDDFCTGLHYPLPCSFYTPASSVLSVADCHRFSSYIASIKWERDYEPPFVIIPSAGLVGPWDRLERSVNGKGYSSGSSSSLQYHPSACSYRITRGVGENLR